jgi:hypothetical protein
MERLWFRLISERCFDSKRTRYQQLFDEWSGLTTAYPGWGLTEIKELSYRERNLWIEMALASKKLIRIE